MNEPIDTLKIVAEGEDVSATSMLDKLIADLERIKGATGTKGLTSLTKKLDTLKDTINDIKPKNLSKLANAMTALSNIKKVSLPPSIAGRIKDIGEAVRSLDGVDFTQLNRMAQGLAEVSRLNASVRIPKVKLPAQDKEPVTDFDEKINIPKEAVTNASRFSTFLSKIKDEGAKVGTRMKSLGADMKKAFDTAPPSRFATVLRSIGRITFYRAIRSMIREVTEAFKTGIDNMYQYSKEFNGSYAQSMDRLASANLSYKNSIGAIMAPIIELVVPWLDKVVDKLFDINNTVAMVIAGLSGKNTYSKAVRVTTEYAAAANKAASNTGKVKDKVEELKRSLAGLDEITIIGDNNRTPLSSASGGNDNVADAVDYSTMFVETPVDMEKVNQIKKQLDTIWAIAKNIAIAIAAWKLTKFISGIVDSIKNMTALQKAMLGITLMITGFTMEWKAGYNIGYGNADVMDYVKMAVGAALGIGGSLLLFGTGPLGWTVGILAALTIGISSIFVGADAKLSDVVQEAFYDSGGTITISDLAGQFERYCKAITDSYAPTVTLGAEIDKLRIDSITPTIGEINAIAGAIIHDQKIAEEKIPLIVEKFKTLYDDSKINLEKTYDLVIKALAGSFGDSLEAMGASVPEAVALITGTTAEMRIALDETNAKVAELKAQYDEGKIGAKEFGIEIQKCVEQIAKINGATSPADEALSGMKDTMNDLTGIDWENQDAASEAMKKISSAAENARDSVNSYVDELAEKLRLLRDNAETDEDRIAYDQLLLGTEQYRKDQMALVAQGLDKIANDVQKSWLEKMQPVYNKLVFEYGEGSSKVEKGLTKYRQEVIAPLTEGLEAAYNKLGMDGFYFAEAAADEIIKGLTADRKTSTTERIISKVIKGWTGIGEDAVTGFTQPFIGLNSKMMKTAADALNGALLGIKTDAPKITSAAGAVADDVLTTLTDANHLDSHSPSKATFKIGKDAMTGLSNGLANNQRVVITALDNCLNNMIERFEIFANRWREGINKLFADMAYSWSNADFKADGSYSYQRIPPRAIPRFAQGGYPEDGLFYANHNELVGQFSNGKTAVANNEQIVEGITEGVSSANEETNQLLTTLIGIGKQLLAKDSTVSVSTIASAFYRQNRRNGKVSVPVST